MHARDVPSTSPGQEKKLAESGHESDCVVYIKKVQSKTKDENQIREYKVQVPNRRTDV